MDNKEKLENRERIKNAKWRQRFHIEPPDGWLNDPNGLSFYKGEYHVYFQYSPIAADGHTPRGWGHYHGSDLMHMTYDRAVMMPDIPEDSHGVYSGSAIENDGVLHIFYTGNVKMIGDYDYVKAGRGANVIHVTTTDGSKMSEKQVLLRNSDYPDFCSCHVRDPKVWKEGDIWKMVLGARTLDDEGCVLVYESDDLINWKYTGKVYKEGYGYMWECPDYFEIGGKGFLRRVCLTMKQSGRTLTNQATSLFRASLRTAFSVTSPSGTWALTSMHRRHFLTHRAGGYS